MPVVILGLYWDHIGIMEEKMETAVVLWLYLGVIYIYI